MRQTKHYYFFLLLGLALAFFSWGVSRSEAAIAQQNVNVKVEDLRKRVAALEDYTQKLQSSMNDFSKNLVNNVDQQLQDIKRRFAVLSPVSSKVVKIETNTGIFLISVQRMDKIDKGYRLYLQVGNPNAATYGDAKLRLFWGPKRDEQSANAPNENWRQSLAGAEYVYPGMLEAGAWTDIVVDLKPAEFSQVQYIECEMDVSTVKLQKTKFSQIDPRAR